MCCLVTATAAAAVVPHLIFYFPTKAILLFSKLHTLVLAFSHFHIFLFILDSFTSSELVEDKNVASLVAAAAVVVVDNFSIALNDDWTIFQLRQWWTVVVGRSVQCIRIPTIGSSSL